MTLGMPLVAAAMHDAGASEQFYDIVVVLGACVVFGLLMQRIGQNVLVGYLLAGLLLGGPSSLGLVSDLSSFSFMGEVGIALLLFTIALDLPYDKVRKFGRMAIVAGGLQVAMTVVLASAVSIALGVGWVSALVIGMAVSLSSTAVVFRVLIDRSESDSVHGLVSTGMLLAQDVVVVGFLLLIPALPGAEGASGGSSGFALDLGLALAKLAALVAGIVAIERVVMRRLFMGSQLAVTRELLAVASLVVSLGAIGACLWLGLSPALGGFVAGLVMADAAYASQVRAEIAPIRMGLVAVFFAYVGMLADLGWMLDNAGSIALLVGLVLVGKAAITWSAARIAHVPRPAAIMTAAALAQLGEFSFAVLNAGDAAGIVEPDTFRLLIGVSLVTLFVTPSMIAGTSRMLHRSSLAAGDGMVLDSDDVEQPFSEHAIVVGAGPAGRTVAATLGNDRVPLTVVELNPRSDTGDGNDDLPSGTRVVFGDAARPEILARANIQSACILVVTIPDPVAIRTIVAQARQLAPKVTIIARGRYNRFVPSIAEAGANEVVDEENLTGTELAAVAVRHLVQLRGEERRVTERRRRSDAETNASQPEE